jgi:hypothetical protein
MLCAHYLLYATAAAVANCRRVALTRNDSMNYSLLSLLLRASTTAVAVSSLERQQRSQWQQDCVAQHRCCCHY